jgi:hypothetical protein
MGLDRRAIEARGQAEELLGLLTEDERLWAEQLLRQRGRA